MMGSTVQPEFGRWEVRMKVDKRGAGGADHPVVALVPYGQDYNGGAGDLDFAETDAGSGEVYCFIHYPGRQDYRKVPIDLEEWHSYAIEVTRSHIAWFIDGEIAMVNTNEAAITGTPWTLNLQLDAYRPGGQAPSTMEVDYFRYHPLPDGSVPTPDGPAPLTGSYP